MYACVRMEQRDCDLPKLNIFAQGRQCGKHFRGHIILFQKLSMQTFTSQLSMLSISLSYPNI